MTECSEEDKEDVDELLTLIELSPRDPYKLKRLIAEYFEVSPADIFVDSTVPVPINDTEVCQVITIIVRGFTYTIHIQGRNLCQSEELPQPLG